MKHDVAIIGGGYSGMAAALQLLRARRSVLVIDAGKRRNRFASHSHGFLTQDGVDPAEIARTARHQLERYDTLEWNEATVEDVTGSLDNFEVLLSDGGTAQARRILFANGVSDTLPAVEGLAERWGRSVFHCPYCHGYELDRGRIGVIAAGPNSLHQAFLLPEWGEVTLFANGVLQPSGEQRVELERRGVALEEAIIVRLENEADVRLADGRLLRFQGLFTAPHNEPASDIAFGLGCELEETPFGRQIRTDTGKETTVAGAFACGDVARVPHSVSLAVADGAWAGAQLHRSLMF